MSELIQQSLNARRCSIRPLFSFLSQIEKDESLGAKWLWTCLLLQSEAIQDWGGCVFWEKNKWHVSLFKTSIGLHLRVILTGIWKNIIYYMYVRSLLTPLKSTVTKSLYVEKVPWSRSRGGGRALSGYLLDQRQPLHYYCKLYNVYCVGQYILGCISHFIYWRIHYNWKILHNMQNNSHHRCKL